MDRSARIYVAGHRGLVGSALVRRLRADGYERLLLRTRSELDLTRQDAVDAFFAAERPDVVLLAAARVGGVLANSTRPAEFARDNLLIQTHVIDAAWRHGVRALLFLGSSCIYPRGAAQPISEEALFSGPLEPTNSAYAVAKLAGIEMCQAYARQHGLRSVQVMPCNLYGPGDSFDLLGSHVLPALLRKMHEAKASGAPEVVVWGTGTPRREFLHVDDLAAACVFLLERGQEGLINVGPGEDVSIRELATLVAEVVGYGGRLTFDETRPDGVARKLLDVSRARAAGWAPRIGLREGLAAVYAWYVANEAAALARASG